jgi:hypothetical protein
MSTASSSFVTIPTPGKSILKRPLPPPLSRGCFHRQTRVEMVSKEEEEGQVEAVEEGTELAVEVVEAAVGEG